MKQVHQDWNWSVSARNQRRHIMLNVTKNQSQYSKRHVCRPRTMSRQWMRGPGRISGDTLRQTIGGPGACGGNLKLDSGILRGLSGSGASCQSIGAHNHAKPNKKTQARGKRAEYWQIVTRFWQTDVMKVWHQSCNSDFRFSSCLARCAGGYLYKNVTDFHQLWQIFLLWKHFTTLTEEHLKGFDFIRCRWGLCFSCIRTVLPIWFNT